MSKQLTHSAIILLIVALVYFWTTNPGLNSLNLQATGFIVLFYFGLRLLTRRARGANETLDSIFLTIIVLLLIFSTGMANSPLFFLIYFLLFFMSLFYEPLQAAFLAVVLTVLFVTHLSFKIGGTTAINLFTLLMIAPLAIIFGRKYLEAEEARGKIKIVESIITSEETDTLLWLSTMAKPTLVNLLDTTSEVIGTNLLSRELQKKLLKLHQDLIALHQSANNLEESIDEQSEV
ncbi:hypothetical protein HYS10_01355 [Candidatus Collierbacteria bacterium]|nr:hypothetical protein [Candidatus Collierbacteria bacterium]